MQTIGAVIDMNDELCEQWKRGFRLPEADAEDGRETHYHPFASEIDWRVAQWVIRQSKSNKAADELMAIPGVGYCYNISRMSDLQKYRSKSALACLSRILHSCMRK